MKVGLIGLGIMGKPMAKNMLKAGVDLTVNDLNPQSVEEIVAAGAKKATSKEIGASCDVVMTMVPNGPQVMQVLFGEDGIAQEMKAGAVFIDMSSINPMTSKEIGAKLADLGIEMLDAPVSGGEPKAIDGTLSIMVGGKEEVFNKHKELLCTMGASVVLCGDIGAGNTTKLANQVVVALNIAAVAEAFTLATMAGVDPELVYQGIRGGLAGSTVMDAKAPMMIEGNFKPGFKIDLHIKDLANAIDCGHQVGAPLPLTSSIQEVLMNLRKDGWGNDDHSAIAKYYAKLSGTKIGK